MEEVVMSDGTYIALKATPRTKSDLIDWMKENRVIYSDNEVFDPHVTLIFSRGEKVEVELLSELEYVYGFKKYTVFGDTCLVIEISHISGANISRRHKYLMNEHSFTWDFHEFIPHVTISHKLGMIDVSKLTPYKGELKFTGEYCEDLELK
jgi:2'-5' RNA ligase